MPPAAAAIEPWQPRWDAGCTRLGERHGSLHEAPPSALRCSKRVGPPPAIELKSRALRSRLLSDSSATHASLVPRAPSAPTSLARQGAEVTT